MIYAMIPILALMIPIVAILSTTVFKPWLELKRREMEQAGTIHGREAGQLIEEIARLRERVQVLERVVTDNHDSLDLDRRIDALRDR